jgi:general stress protein 26
MMIQHGQDSEAVERDIFELMNRHNLMVVSSQNETGSPQSAVVEFLLKHDFVVYFATVRSFRKYQNLTSNPRVSLVIGGADEVTVQYEGTATEVTPEEIPDDQKSRLAPHVRKGFDPPVVEKSSVAYFKITPQWIRYTDVSNLPWKITEVKFD